MLLYHGSPKEFKRLRVHKDLCRHDIQTVLPEGIGIYMTNKLEVAKSYGEFVYTLEVKDSTLIDMTYWEGINQVFDLLRNFMIRHRFDFDDYIEAKVAQRIIEGIVYGVIPCTGLDRELSLCFDSNAKFYEDYNDIETITELLEEANRKVLEMYVMKYNDTSLGVVYIAKNPDLVKILKCVRSCI